MNEEVNKGFYAVTQLSKNKYIDNDGMLVCKNAILGKAGTQYYAGYELGLDTGQAIAVKRPEEEVFNDESLASLKGKTITLNHPDEDINVDNVSYLSIGFIMDVRKDGNYIIGDIKVTDKEAIELIQDKEMIELSLGYEARLEPSEDNTLIQRDIAYNHLALVKRGRAEVARIVDENKKIRVVDKQFEEGERLFMEETAVQRVLSAMGLRKKDVEPISDAKPDSTEPQMSKEPEEGQEEKSTAPPKNENPEPNQETSEPEVDNKGSEDFKQLLDEALEEVKNQNKDEPQEPSEPEPEKGENVKVNDGENKGDEGMEKLDEFITKAQKIEEIKDETLKTQLKDALVKEYYPEKEQENDNSALNDFKNTPLKDAGDKIEKVDAGKEIKQMYDDLNPHNYDNYEDYVKYRKKLGRESGEENITETLEEGLGE